MALATWWTGDAFPGTKLMSGFSVSRTLDDERMAHLNGVSVAEVVARRAAGHRAYVGFIDGTPVTYGWVATREAEIGELNLRFALPRGDRYLWDFATLPEWQGRGLYPQILHAILIAESSAAERFWIIHAPENLPSGAGMYKAGFTTVGRLSFGGDGRVALTPSAALERARAGAHVLGVPLTVEALTPCWRCRTSGEAAAGCACCATETTQDTCSCAIPVRPSRVPVIELQAR